MGSIKKQLCNLYDNQRKSIRTGNSAIWRGMLNLMILLLGKFWMPKRVFPWLSVYPMFAVIMGKI